MPTTQERWSVTLTVGGRVIGVFDSFSGGRVSGEARVYHAGGMAPPTSEVSPAEAENITISRGYNPSDAPLVKWLRERIGYDAVVAAQALDHTRTAVRDGLTTYTTRIVSVSAPEHDSMGRDWNRFEVELVVEGLPA